MSRIVGAFGEVDLVAAWKSLTPAYFPYITQAKYEKLRPAAQKWYEPYRCVHCRETVQ